MSQFLGFDLGDVLHVRIRSYTIGPGGSAQLTGLGLELEQSDGPTYEIEVEFGRDGPTLAQARALIATLNRRLEERRGEES